MQSILVSPLITKEKMLTFKEYKKFDNVNEYILYGDNILEGITLLNDMISDSNYLSFIGVIYEPIDQPIYIFKDNKQNIYSIKICGAYDKWKLPREVAEIINFVDLPDYIIYSIKSKKVIIAGENTETASVGNSQWQREGRKLGAARIGVPFIYQTFYSGRDESQDKIREPNSLQVFNHLVYSVRYKVPSFVAYFENNFDNSQTRIRNPLDSKLLFSKYLKAIIIYDVDKTTYARKRQLEKEFYLHMIEYIKEPKYIDLNKKNYFSRLKRDLPILSSKIYDQLINNSEEYVERLLDYIYESNPSKINQYLEDSDIINFDNSKYRNWTSYNSKHNITEILNYLRFHGCQPLSYINRSSKVGFADIKLTKSFLINKFPEYSDIFNEILLDKYKEAVILPLRIHKMSNDKLTFSPDPESGEIVAFSELFGYDLRKNKIRPIIGYCIVDTPRGFNISDKAGTKLYKALAEYIDILIINNNKVITNWDNKIEYEDHIINNLESIKPISVTEEMAVVSTFINQTTINSNWKLCFIHTHHSSWQQLVIYNKEREVQKKVDRVSTKVDLITQNNNLFMIAEGKNTYSDILRDNKIKKAMQLASKSINDLYDNISVQFDAFIYNYPTVQNKDPDFFVNREADTISESIKMGHFNDIAFHESFVVIIVYTDSNNCTKFKLIYSPKFNSDIKVIMDRSFCNEIYW